MSSSRRRRRMLLLLSLLIAADGFFVGDAPVMTPQKRQRRPIGRRLLRPIFEVPERLMSNFAMKLYSLVRRYRYKRRPRRIILIRHGESEGNRDSSLYATVPDNQIQLTQLGFQQAQEAGVKLRQLVGDESVSFIYSPYRRTRQTVGAILDAFQGRTVELSSEPRLREQDFGNFQDAKQMKRCIAERKKFGRFFYRFPNGEAGTDVYDRAGELWGSLFRYMDRPTGKVQQNIVIVTHGLLMRILCMSYFRWTVLEFEQVWNPPNGGLWVLEKRNGGKYELTTKVNFGPTADQKLFAHMTVPMRTRSYVVGDSHEVDQEMHLMLNISSSEYETAVKQAIECRAKLLRLGNVSKT